MFKVLHVLQSQVKAPNKVTHGKKCQCRLKNEDFFYFYSSVPLRITFHLVGEKKQFHEVLILINLHLYKDLKPSSCIFHYIIPPFLGLTALKRFIPELVVPYTGENIQCFFQFQISSLFLNISLQKGLTMYCSTYQIQLKIRINLRFFLHVREVCLFCWFFPNRVTDFSNF